MENLRQSPTSPCLPKGGLIVLLTLIYTFFICRAEASKLIDEQTGEEITVNTYSFFFGRQLTGEAIRAELRHLDAGDVCRGSLPNLDRIVAFVPQGACVPARKARKLSQAGAIGAVIDVGHTVPGFYAYWFDSRTAEDIALSIVVMSTVQKDSEIIGNMLSSAQRRNATVSIQLEASKSPWGKVVDSPAWVFFQVSMTLFGLMNMTYATWKMFVIVSTKGCKLSIPVFCLSMELCANMLRTVVVAVDPVATRRVFDITSNFVLFTITIPLTLITSIVLVFFFHELTSGNKLSASSFLTSPASKIGAASLGVFLFIGDVTTSVLRSRMDTSVDGLFLGYNVVVSLVVVVVASIFFHSTFRLRQELLSRARTNSEQTIRSTNHLLFSVFLTAVFMSFECFFRLIAVWIPNAWAWYAFIFCGTLMSNAKSASQIFAFTAQRERATKRGSAVIPSSPRDVRANRSSSGASTRPTSTALSVSVVRTGACGDATGELAVVPASTESASASPSLPPIQEV